MSDNTDDIDPSIAALLAEATDSLPESTSALKAEEEQIEKKELDANNPEEAKKQRAEANEVPPVDLSVQHFNPIAKFFEDKPSPIFDDPNYYKVALTGEGESAQRLHQVLVKYLNCTDPKDRTVYRQQIISSYWGFITNLAPKMANVGLPQCKRMLMRFGVVLPSLFSPEQKNFFSRSIMNNTTGEPVFYMDEWMKEIAAGRLTLSATDETPANRAKGDRKSTRL